MLLPSPACKKHVAEGSMADASATTAAQSAHPPARGYRTAKERCDVMMGTAQPSQECVPQHLLILSHPLCTVSSARMSVQRDDVHHTITISIGNEGSDEAPHLIRRFPMCQCQRHFLQIHTWSSNSRNATSPGLASQTERRASNAVETQRSTFCQTCPASVRRVRIHHNQAQK